MLAGFGGEVDQVSPEGRPGIAETVWPLVKARVLLARLQVVGRGPTPAERTLVDKTGDAELHADIPDPKSYLRQASVAVNPAVSGSGGQHKAGGVSIRWGASRQHQPWHGRYRSARGRGSTCR